MKVEELFDQPLFEAAPPSKEAEDWINDNKKEFQKRYGDRWEEVIYARAWVLYKKGSFE